LCGNAFKRNRTAVLCILRRLGSSHRIGTVILGITIQVRARHDELSAFAAIVHFDLNGRVRRRKERIPREYRSYDDCGDRESCLQNANADRMALCSMKKRLGLLRRTKTHATRAATLSGRVLRRM